MAGHNKSILEYMSKSNSAARGSKRAREEAADDNKAANKADQDDQAQKTKEESAVVTNDSSEKQNDGDAVEPASKRIKTDGDATGPTASTSTAEATAPAEPITLTNFETALDPGWKEHIGAEFKKPYFQSLKKFLIGEAKQGVTIFPPVKDVFNAFRLCKYDQVKVVLIGQDPYIQKGQAHGLCFSVESENVARPPSLKNIFTELHDDIPGFTAPKHSNLTKWAEQGVLLLNAVMTVREGVSNSHAKKGWETFTDAVIEHLNRNKKGLIFVLWGKPAQDKGKRIDTKKHHVLKAAHPSPLSASKGFFGCKHFSQCNALLPADQQIDWAKINT